MDPVGCNFHGLKITYAVNMNIFEIESIEDFGNVVYLAIGNFVLD